MIIKNYLRDPLKYGILSLSLRGYLRWLPDKTYLKWNYWANIKKRLNLKNPKTFNEKLQWLKLYDRKLIYTTMVDKYAVKKYVADRIGAEYVIPTLGVWDSPEEIDFDSLPNQFVLKVTHDSGGLVICKDKSKLDIEAAKAKLARSLKRDYYLQSREWPYKNVKRRILAEKFMVDASDKLDDYKLLCFGGQVKCSFVCSDRFSGKGLHITFFDRDWQVMPFERSYPSVKEGVPKPVQYEKMVELAEILSMDIPFVRVDFYEVDGKIYFGELTFYPGSGFEAFQPESWDETLGQWIQLPNISNQ